MLECHLLSKTVLLHFNVQTYMALNFKQFTLTHIWQVLSCDCMERENTAQICAHFKKIKKILDFALPSDWSLQCCWCSIHFFTYFKVIHKKNPPTKKTEKTQRALCQKPTQSHSGHKVLHGLLSAKGKMTTQDYWTNKSGKPPINIFLAC